MSSGNSLLLGYHLYRFFWAGMDFIYPPLCGGCNGKGERWCKECQKKTLLIQGALCGTCGEPQKNAGICKSCEKQALFYQRARSWAVFKGPLRKAIHRIKYKQDMGIGERLASETLPYIRDLNWQVDLVLPVPLGKKRLKERGYNQVNLFALPIALAMGWKYSRNSLERVRETISQVGLSAEERKNNMHDAFWADRQKVEGKSILVMDDVYTTGSTLNSCAKALLDGGAKEIFVLSLARAL